MINFIAGALALVLEYSSYPAEPLFSTEVQLLSFVCSTGGKGSKSRLWNIQNLGAV